MNALGKETRLYFAKGKNRPKREQAHSWLDSPALKGRRLLESEYLVVTHPVTPDNIRQIGKIIRKNKTGVRTNFVAHPYGKFRRTIDNIEDSLDLAQLISAEDRKFFREAKVKMSERHRLTPNERLALAAELKERRERYEHKRTRPRRAVSRLLEGTDSARDRTGRINPSAMVMKLLHIDPYLEEQQYLDALSQQANDNRAEVFVRLTSYINQRLEAIYKICWSPDYRILLNHLGSELDRLPFSPFHYAVAVIKHELLGGSFIPQRAVWYFEAELALLDYDDALSALRDGLVVRDQLDFSRMLADLHIIRSGPYERLAGWINEMNESADLTDAETVEQIKRRLHERVDLEDPATLDWLNPAILADFKFETAQLPL